jgi:hypothetical protein
MHSLVSSVHPTLLINAPDLSSSMRRFCQTSNYAGLFALGNRGLPSSVPCSKVFFVGSQTDPDWLSGTAVRLVLPISNSQFLPLDPRLQTEIAQHYQPQWLQFRLDHFLRVQTSGRVVESGAPVRAAVRQLQACFPDQAELCGELAEMIQAQDEDARAGNFLDPSPAIIEVLWPFFHSSEKPITVGRLTEFVNTLIRSRGGVREYDPAEIGTLLSKLSVNRWRKNSGVYISVDPDSSRRVHRLAAAYGVAKAIPGCAFCQEAGIKEEQGTASHENGTGQANDAKGSEGGVGGDGVCNAGEGRDPACP